MAGRAKDNRDWTKFSKSLMDAGIEAFKAAGDKDAKVFAQGAEDVYDSCEKRHAKYLPKLAH